MTIKILKVASVLAMFTLLYACGSGENENRAQNGRGMEGMGPGTEKAAIPVQTAVVKRGDISTFLLHTTTIEAEKVVDVVSKVAGHVVKLAVEEGMQVKKGQILAQLNEAELKIDLLQAKVRMETDKNALDRAQDMLSKNLIAKENFDTVQMQYESSKAAYEAARLKVEYTEVEAPISGVISNRHIELGQRVNANEILFTIADFNPLRARIYVPEKDIARVFVGQEAIIKVDALADREFTGKVTMISPVVDPTNGTVKVTIDIDGAQKWLKPGMFASIYITTEKHENTLLIPKKALLLESETDQVYVMQDGRAHKVALTIGFSSGDNVEVLDGLQEGQQVVTIGQDGLREGLPIKVPGEQIVPEETVTQAGIPEQPQKPQKNLKQQETVTKTSPVQQDRPKEKRPVPMDEPKVTPSQPQKTEPSAQVDMEMLKQLETEILESRFGRRFYDMRVSEDPTIETDPVKKMAYFKEFVGTMLGRISERSPEVAEAFEAEVAKDPEMETNLLKQYRFLRDRMRTMRGGPGQ